MTSGSSRITSYNVCYTKLLRPNGIEGGGKDFSATQVVRGQGHLPSPLFGENSVEVPENFVNVETMGHGSLLQGFPHRPHAANAASYNFV